MKINPASLAFAISIALVPGFGASADATEVATEPAPQIFRDPKPVLGQQLKVTGLLRWAGENRNLFPVGTDPANTPEPLCLPVLIKGSNRALIKRVQKFDAMTVEIKGRIVATVPSGDVDLGSCKPIGIEVQTIEPVR